MRVFLIIFNYVFISMINIVMAEHPLPEERFPKNLNGGAQIPYGVYGSITEFYEDPAICEKYPTECGYSPLVDRMWILPTTTDKARVHVDLTFAKGHTCGIRSGVGEVKNNDYQSLYVTQYYHSLDPEFPSIACKFKIVFEGVNASFIDDEDNPCREKYCGARGGFNNSTLRLINAYPGSEY